MIDQYSLEVNIIKNNISNNYKFYNYLPYIFEFIYNILKSIYIDLNIRKYVYKNKLGE
jgi:hypothetical protein